jgi:hypothetical protein
LATTLLTAFLAGAGAAGVTFLDSTLAGDGFFITGTGVFDRVSLVGLFSGNLETTGFEAALDTALGASFLGCDLTTGFKSIFLTNFLALLSGFEIGLTVFLGATLTEALGTGLPFPVVTYLGVVDFDAGFSTFLPDDLEALG